MNTKKRGGYRGFSIYMMLILVIILIWFWLSGNSATGSYTKAQFVNDLEKENNSQEATTFSLDVQEDAGVPAWIKAVKETASRM